MSGFLKNRNSWYIAVNILELKSFLIYVHPEIPMTAVLIKRIFTHTYWHERIHPASCVWQHQYLDWCEVYFVCGKMIYTFSSPKCPYTYTSGINVFKRESMCRSYIIFQHCTPRFFLSHEMFKVFRLEKHHQKYFCVLNLIVYLTQEKIGSVVMGTQVTKCTKHSREFHQPTRHAH